MSSAAMKGGAAAAGAKDENEVKENNKGEQQHQQHQQQQQQQQQQQLGGAAPTGDNDAGAVVSSGSHRARQPFTQLSQIEADMALARALQEQERAYMILRSGEHYGYEEYDNGGEDSDEDEDNDGSDESETPPQGESDSMGSREFTIDGSQFESDEAYARALQEHEDRESTARLMALAGIHDGTQDEEAEGEEAEEGEDDQEEDEEEEEEDDEVNDEDISDAGSEEMWQDVDPDTMSYEQLLALGEFAGTHTKGLSTSTIAELPTFLFKRATGVGCTSSDSEQCVICRLDYEENELLLTLPCKHKYHSECIQQWLQINKVCPVCSAEVGTSSSS